MILIIITSRMRIYLNVFHFFYSIVSARTFIIKVYYFFPFRDSVLIANLSGYSLKTCLIISIHFQGMAVTLCIQQMEKCEKDYTNAMNEAIFLSSTYPYYKCIEYVEYFLLSWMKLLYIMYYY